MPLDKLIKLKTFSPRRIKQLHNEKRLLHILYNRIKRGEKMRWKKSGKLILANDVIKKYSQVCGLLWALGYVQVFDQTNELKRKAFPLIKIAYSIYQGRVRKIMT